MAPLLRKVKFVALLLHVFYNVPSSPENESMEVEVPAKVMKAYPKQNVAANQKPSNAPTVNKANKIIFAHGGGFRPRRCTSSPTRAAP